MDAKRESELLVGLWQELQSAQVAGDTARLDELRRVAEGHAARSGASEEWRLLAREAGRHTERLDEQREAQPEVAVGGDGGEHERVEEVAAPEAAREPAEEGAPERQGLRLGPLIWIVILVGWLILQLIGNVGEGGAL